MRANNAAAKLGVLSALGLLLANAAAVGAPPPPAGAPETRLISTVTVLPFATAARPDTGAATDSDGYRAVWKRFKAPADGPAAMTARMITMSGKAVGLPTRKDPRAEAPLSLTGVFTAFEHRKVETPQPKWEAYVELFIRLKDTWTGEEYFREFYSGAAPAKGPLARGVEQEIFRKGIGAYAGTPLGLAFRQAVTRALNGSMERGVAAKASPPGLLSLLQGMTGQARVTGTEQNLFRINAGSANGLAPGNHLTAYQLADRSDLSGKPFDLLGTVTVVGVEPHAALVKVLDGRIGAGTTVMAGRQAEALKTKAILDLGDGSPPPAASFTGKLKLLLDQFEVGNPGDWSRDSLEARCQVLRQDPRPLVRVTLIDRRGRQRAVLDEWTGYVTQRDGPLHAVEAFLHLTRKLSRGPSPDRLLPSPTRPVDPAARRAAYEGDLRQILGNRREGFQVRLAWHGPPTADSLRPGGEVNLVLNASQRCHGIVYSYGADRKISVVWPAPDPMTGKVVPAVLERGQTPITGRVSVPLGPEYLVAVGWSDREAAVELLKETPDSLVGVGQRVRLVAASREGVMAAIPSEARGTAASAEPSAKLPSSLAVEAAEALRAAASETPDYSTGWLYFRTGR